MSDDKIRADIVPVHARFNQVVVIHWRMPDGQVVKVSMKCPVNGEQSVREVSES